MNKFFLGGIAVILILGLVFLIAPKSNKTISPSPLPVTSLSPTASNNLLPSSSSTLPQGGSSFLDPKGVFSVLYPNDYKLDTQNNGQFIRLTKIGPSQKGQTEIYDGVIVHFESVNLGNQTLSQWVDAQIQNATADGTSEVVTPKKSVTINGYPGFTYSLRGLGVSEYIVLQKDESSKFAVNLTTLVADPTNQGFQQQVDAILASLQLLK